MYVKQSKNEPVRPLIFEKKKWIPILVTCLKMLEKIRDIEWLVLIRLINIVLGISE